MIPRLCLFVFFVSLSAHASFTLEDCYQAALKRSETVAFQDAEIDQAEERYSQAKGSFLPRLDGIATYQRLPKPNGQETAFTRSERPEVRINATQAVFRGFREFAGIRKTRLDVVAQENRRQAAANTLYRDVAENFYTVLSLEQDLRNLETELSLSRKRVDELQERRRIGRSRRSEVLSFESTVATLESQATQVSAQIAAAREAFAFLTGFERTASLADTEPMNVKLDGLDKYLERLDDRPDIQALIKDRDSADESISIARGQHLPSIDLGANYYLKRVGVLETQKWDFLATLTVPIFAGGAVQSQVRQAASQLRQSELDLSLSRKRAEQEVRSFHYYVQNDKTQLESLKRAAELAERNYDEQSKEYRLGLVTNLDVLQALNASQDTRRAYDRVRYQLKLDVARLETAVALRPRPAPAPGESK